MKRFSKGQRVIVYSVMDNDEEIEIPGGELGNVARLLMRDNSAWIELDRRVDIPGAHPFPVDDSRHRHVRAFPDQCSDKAVAARVSP